MAGGKDALLVAGNGGKINKDSIIPIYYQLTQYIKQQLANSIWKVGDRIPSEREFCSQFKISRMTVRGAIESLKKEGLIYSKKGLGNFVCVPKFDQKLNKLTSFTDDMLGRGFKPGSKTLSLKRMPAPAGVAEILHINKGDEVINLKRLRLANDEPMALEDTYINESLVPGLLENYESGDSLYKTMNEKFGIELLEATESIEVGLCNNKDAKLLEVKPGLPVFSIRRATLTKERQPIEAVLSIYRGDRYTFSMQLEV